MKKLDLHGTRHDDVDRMVENFIFKEDFPHQIITGHSTKMNSIVVNVLERHRCTRRMGVGKDHDI